MHSDIIEIETEQQGKSNDSWQTFCMHVTFCTAQFLTPLLQPPTC